MSTEKEIVCPRCTYVNPPDAKFCRECKLSFVEEEPDPAKVYAMSQNEEKEKTKAEQKKAETTKPAPKPAQQAPLTRPNKPMPVFHSTNSSTPQFQPTNKSTPQFQPTGASSNTTSTASKPKSTTSSSSTASKPKSTTSSSSTASKPKSTTGSSSTASKPTTTTTGTTSTATVINSASWRKTGAIFMLIAILLVAILPIISFARPTTIKGIEENGFLITGEARSTIKIMISDSKTIIKTMIENLNEVPNNSTVAISGALAILGNIFVVIAAIFFTVQAIITVICALVAFKRKGFTKLVNLFTSLFLRLITVFLTLAMIPTGDIAGGYVFLYRWEMSTLTRIVIIACLVIVAITAILSIVKNKAFVLQNRAQMFFRHIPSFIGCVIAYFVAVKQELYIPFIEFFTISADGILFVMFLGLFIVIPLIMTRTATGMMESIKALTVYSHLTDNDIKNQKIKVKTPNHLALAIISAISCIVLDIYSSVNKKSLYGLDKLCLTLVILFAITYILNKIMNRIFAKRSKSSTNSNTTQWN